MTWCKWQLTLMGLTTQTIMKYNEIYVTQIIAIKNLKWNNVFLFGL